MNPLFYYSGKGGRVQGTFAGVGGPFDNLWNLMYDDKRREDEVKIHDSKKEIQNAF